MCLQTTTLTGDNSSIGSRDNSRRLLRLLPLLSILIQNWLYRSIKRKIAQSTDDQTPRKRLSPQTPAKTSRGCCNDNTSSAATTTTTTPTTTTNTGWGVNPKLLPKSVTRTTRRRRKTTTTRTKRRRRRRMEESSRRRRRRSSCSSCRRRQRDGGMVIVERRNRREEWWGSWWMQSNSHVHGSLATQLLNCQENGATQQPTTLLSWGVRVDWFVGWLVGWLVWVFLLWIQLVGGRNQCCPVIYFWDKPPEITNIYSIFLIKKSIFIF